MESHSHSFQKSRLTEKSWNALHLNLFKFQHYNITMATIIHTILKFQSEADLKEVLALTKNEDRLFDFEKIIPSPATREECVEKYGEEFLLLESEPIQQQPDKPWFSWYRWRKALWGTHCNATNVNIEGCELSFDTENLPAFQIIVALKDLFPKIEFTHQVQLPH